MKGCFLILLLFPLTFIQSSFPSGPPRRQSLLSDPEEYSLGPPNSAKKCLLSLNLIPNFLHAHSGRHAFDFLLKKHLPWVVQGCRLVLPYLMQCRQSWGGRFTPSPGLSGRLPDHHFFFYFSLICRRLSSFFFLCVFLSCRCLISPDDLLSEDEVPYADS